MIWRVRDRATFAALAQARPRRAGPVRIRAVPHRAGPPAVAYAVGRRAGSAVARNRLRRRLRAAVHERADLLSRDTAYLVGADPAALTMSFAALSDALARALPGPDPGSGGPVPHAPEPGR